jgi:pSer/pThr/pTyr-binding forkhead associated (FHA) protein
MEADRMSDTDRTLVPHRFAVHLNPSDLDPLRPLATSLAAELADAALAFARTHRYALRDRPRVELVADPRVAPGEIDVMATFEESDPAAAGGAVTGRAMATDTMVFTVPHVISPSAILREIRADGTRREVRVDGSLLTIGRAPDNHVVVADRRVSRHHARIQARHGSLVLSDLGSTNGTQVNGSRVDEMVLGEGDRIEIGSTLLVVEAVPAVAGQSAAADGSR